MTKKILHLLALPVILVAAFAGTSLAAGAISPDGGSLSDLLTPLVDAFRSHNWWLMCGLGMVVVCALLKKYAPAKIQTYLHTDVGGSALLLVASFGAALAASLSGASAVPMSGELAWSALKLAMVAAGGYSLIKKLLVNPLLDSKWYADHAPAWLKGVITLATAAFTKPDVVAEAEKAGDAAVAAKPAEGADGIVGKSTEL